LSGENFVGFCDVDWTDWRKGAVKTFEKFPDVPKWKDFRVMFDEIGDKIDAVTVSTPDHMHFPIAKAAIERGKHVYVQKPLTHSIGEARELLRLAREHKVITQMGNQGHANNGTRMVREWIQGGVIGPVRELHIWTNRPIWPQGLELPTEVQPVPEGLDWNLWLGTAPFHEYNKAYAPFKWRGWWDFGCGALGDMGCHIMDAGFWALDLGMPEKVEAESEGMTGAGAPKSSKVTYHFPARGEMPPVRVVWYDGDWKPERPADLEADKELDSNGQYYLGDDGTILDQTPYCTSPRIIPLTKMREMMPNLPEKTIPRTGSPYKEWTDAIRGEGPEPGANFEYSVPLTEMVLLGNLAIRAEKPIEWDAENATVKGMPELDVLINKPVREF
jgi:predicted dehydrogenase